MKSGRPLAIALFGAVTLLAASVSSATAAILLTTLSVQSASPGVTVTLRIDMTGRLAGTEPGVLVLVPAAAHDAATPCEQNAGATVLGDMTWSAGQVAFQGSSYPGMKNETRFTVPPVPVGDYRLAETWDGLYTKCFVYASFAVTLPDTAMVQRRAASPLVALGFAALLMSALMLWTVTRGRQR